MRHSASYREQHGWESTGQPHHRRDGEHGHYPGTALTQHEGVRHLLQDKSEGKGDAARMKHVRKPNWAERSSSQNGAAAYSLSKKPLQHQRPITHYLPHTSTEQSRDKTTQPKREQVQQTVWSSSGTYDVLICCAPPSPSQDGPSVSATRKHHGNTPDPHADKDEWVTPWAAGSP